MADGYHNEQDSFKENQNSLILLFQSCLKKGKKLQSVWKMDETRGCSFILLTQKFCI